MDTFEGIPDAAFRFYAELENNNNRDWWLEHKGTYGAAVNEPLSLLLAELEQDFGPAKIFRPNRDIRFSPDKSPYKTYQGGFASQHEGTGYYVQLSSEGLLIGGGGHTHSPEQIARYRAAVDAPTSGEALKTITDAVAEAGFAIEGEKLKTVPRGFPRDHPRGELLKHKSLSASVALGQPDWLPTEAASQEVALLWEQLRPLVDWIGRHAAP